MLQNDTSIYKTAKQHFMKLVINSTFQYFLKDTELLFEDGDSSAILYLIQDGSSYFNISSPNLGITLSSLEEACITSLISLVNLQKEFHNVNRLAFCPFYFLFFFYFEV